MSKPLNGKEASILCIIAMVHPITSKQEKKILSHLKGDALKIARAIIGHRDSVSASQIKTAEGFIEWANQLK